MKHEKFSSNESKKYVIWLRLNNCDSLLKEFLSNNYIFNLLRSDRNNWHAVAVFVSRQILWIANSVMLLIHKETNFMFPIFPLWEMDCKQDGNFPQ